MLKEVSEDVRPAGFWADFVKRFARNEDVRLGVQLLGEDFPGQWDTFKVATHIAKDYPTARDFLHEALGMSNRQLDQYPKAQVVLLAIVKYNQFAYDEAMKQFVLPFPSQAKNDESELSKHWSARFNPNPGRPNLKSSLLPLGDIFVPGTRQVIGAAMTTQQHQNLWQTVEAVRLTAAENGGKLPASLDQLAVPAPLDPATNRPFEYELDGDVATLRGTGTKLRNFHIKLELANEDNPKEEVK